MATKTTTTSVTSPLGDDFRVEWHGNAVVVTPSPKTEQMPWEVIEPAAEIVMKTLGTSASPMAVFDLSQVEFFGSTFMALLLRCQKVVKQNGGELVLCGPSKGVRDLLKLMRLDLLWAIYDTLPEALQAVDD